jgi:DNA repair protein RadC
MDAREKNIDCLQADLAVAPRRGQSDKPDARERLRERGARYLSDQDLVALLLRSGTKAAPVLNLADRVIATLGRREDGRLAEELGRIDGMGSGKVASILAALELGRRFSPGARDRIKCAQDLFPLVRHYAERKQEQFVCASLNGAHEVIAIRVVSLGILNRTIVHPREVYGDPLSDRAAAIIVCHNHPSGQLEPSEEDIQITRRLREAGTILGINLLDHLILSPQGDYFSFVESGISLDGH